MATDFGDHAYRGAEYDGSYRAVFWQPRGRGNNISGHAEEPAASTAQRRGRRIIPIVTQEMHWPDRESHPGLM
jgi:hypothetical protein